MKRGKLGIVSLLLVCAPMSLFAYPLDGFPETGIRRIEYNRLVNDGILDGQKQPVGALLPASQVRLGLEGKEDFDNLEPDPEFSHSVVEMLGEQADRYSLMVLDLSFPGAPRLAEHRGQQKQNVGSVGKLLVAQGLFQALADAYPDDIGQRKNVLRTSEVIADAFSVSDHHTIRMFDTENQVLTRRPMQIGDNGSLWEHLDWMLSVSSNSAASMVMREAMLLKAQRVKYPEPDSERRAFFETTPAQELTRLFQQTFWNPVRDSGLDLDRLRQGSFFTRGGKQKVNGGGDSYATARSLLDWILLLEQGRLVDSWSSLEIKKLLYVTERRIRYASAPELAAAAVYSKSGSWWGCKEEPGFDCQPYHGNLRNYMNSVSIIEEGSGDQRLYYIVVLVSNVLKENSAVTHQALAGKIHKLIREQHLSLHQPANGSGQSSSISSAPAF